MLVYQAADEYCCSIMDLSHHTQRWYREKLAVFVEWCEKRHILLEDIEPATIGKFTETIRERVNPKTGKQISTFTAHGYIQVVKGFLYFCARDEKLGKYVSINLPRRIRMPRREQKIIETFTPQQIRRLFEACDRERTVDLAMRDQAILSVLVDTGVRASELCGLTLDHVYLSPRSAYIKVFGKGMKWREVGLGQVAKAALHEYIANYRHASVEERHVFLSRRTGKSLTVDGLYQMIDRLGEWARIKGVRCSPHTLRHSFSVGYLEAGGDIYKLCILMGHNSVKTTEIYLKTYNARTARMTGISVLDRQQNKGEDEWAG